MRTSRPGGRPSATGCGHEVEPIRNVGSLLEVEMALKAKDTVALLEDVPARHLERGQVGTVLEKLGRELFEVEFDDDEGENFATLALKADQLLVLHH